jgi:hypothetical protein
MRRIVFSKIGIHFETEQGVINAHWIDLVGMGLCKEIPNRILRSMGRFWFQFFYGLIYIITKKGLM